MKRKLLLFLLLSPLFVAAQIDNPYDHTGAQFATQGTDFWVAFPRTFHGLSPNKSRLYVVSERDCDVTVSAPWLGWERTVHIIRRQMCGPDTNYIEVPQAYSRFSDTITIPTPLDHFADFSNVSMNFPQPRAFHVTSTDTISLFIWIHSLGVSTALNVLPTELLRDEYVVQVYPKIYIDNDARVDTTTITPFPHLDFFNHQYIIRQMSQIIDIVGVEDSTVVDIVLNDWDFLNRKKGDTITLTLNAGQLYHINGGEVREKYYPLFAPYFSYYDIRWSSHLTDTLHQPYITNYNFAGDTMRLDTFIVDLSGTHIKSHDCKPFAVFEGGSIVFVPREPIDSNDIDDPGTCDMVLEQSIPIRFAGTRFLIPTILDSKQIFTRITGLQDNTDITVIEAHRGASDSRHLTVNKGQTVWFMMTYEEGPLFIETSHPAIVKVYTRESENLISKRGDESGFTVIPEEWWHHGQINYGTITEKDEFNNRQRRLHSLYIFSRTEDVASLRIDDYPVASYFNTIRGTPFSYARFAPSHSFNSEGTHHIESLTNRRFMAVQSSVATEEAAVFNLPHLQSTGLTLYINERSADSIPADTLWCHFEHINFRAVNRRPADSLYWDFGDGTRLALSHRQPDFYEPVPHTFPAAGRYTVQAIFTYEKEGCFTIPNDTLSVTLLFTGHVDSTITDTLCEGTYTFRGEEFETTGIYKLTTYRTLTGCDTLWTLDLTICPHCYWTSDTIAPDELPYVFNGVTFGTEAIDHPIYIPISDNCDSIIYYTLVVIPHWGEPPLDSTWVLVPNIFTPDLSTNNLFAVTCSHHIRQIEVMLFDRRGDFVYKFDGLTGHWDGTHDGRPCPQATYVYYIRYIDSKDNAWKTLTGTVSLIR